VVGSGYFHEPRPGGALRHVPALPDVDDPVTGAMKDKHGDLDVRKDASHVDLAEDLCKLADLLGRSDQPFEPSPPLLEPLVVTASGPSRSRSSPVPVSVTNRL
jgi:hypothetical protein